MNWYIQVLKKYAVFSGRAGRAEFWYFVLFNTIVLVPLAIGGNVGVTAFSVLAILYMIAMLTPGLAVSVRRLHDTGRSGLWLFISLIPFIGFLILLVFLASASKEGIAQYVPSPKLSAPVRQELPKDIENAKRDLDILAKCRTRDEVIDGLNQIAALISQEKDPAAMELASMVLRSAQSLRDSPSLSDEMVLQLRDQYIEVFNKRYNDFLSLFPGTASRDDSQEVDIVAESESPDKTEVTTQGEPVSESRLYLWVIRQNKQPSQKLLKAVFDHYGEEGDVILGGHRTDELLPRGADDYVIITCLRVCKENNIVFDSARDIIVYSVDIIDGEEIGVCQIRVQAEKVHGADGTKVVEPQRTLTTSDSKGIQILLELFSTGGELYPYESTDRAVQELRKEQSSGSRALAGIITELLACRSKDIEFALIVAQGVSAVPELIEAVRAVASASETTSAPAECNFFPEIFGEGKVGWTSGTYNEIKEIAADTLDILSGVKTKEEVLQQKEEAKKDVEALIKTLRNENNHTAQINAAIALGRTGDTRAVDPLIDALSNEIYGLRLNAALALGMIKDVRAVEPLTKVLEDENPSVRREAAEALKQIQG